MTAATLRPTMQSTGPAAIGASRRSQPSGDFQRSLDKERYCFGNRIF